MAETVSREAAVAYVQQRQRWLQSGEEDLVDWGLVPAHLEEPRVVYFDDETGDSDDEPEDSDDESEDGSIEIASSQSEQRPSTARIHRTQGDLLRALMDIYSSV